MTLKQLIKTKFGTVRAFLDANKDWGEPSTRTLMSRGVEVLELANGDYILINKQTKIIGVGIENNIE